MKKFLALVLTLTMIFCCVPFGAFSINASAAGVTSGTTGDCSWTLDGTVLTISGNGATDSYFWDDTPWGFDITEVIIEEGVTYLGDKIFADCAKLSKVTLCNTLENIRMNAFEYCESLESIEIPDSVKYIGADVFYNTGIYNNEDNWEDGVLYIGKHLICSDKNEIKGEYTIKEGTLTLAFNAFKNCDSLTSVVIPNTVANIGTSAFYDCDKLKSINIPQSVKIIGFDAFCDCEALENVYITDLTAWCNIEFDNGFANPLEYAQNFNLNGSVIKDELVIPEDVTTVSAYTFYGLKSITSVVLGNSVKVIGREAFSYCKNLISAKLPDSLTDINYRAFYSCNMLCEINIPDSVTYIDQMAIDGTAYYKDDTNWENGVLYLGRHVYKAIYDEVIGEYAVKEGTLTIIERAFMGCQEITSVILPEGLTTLGYEAFCYCPKLESVTLPLSVTYIGEYAFDDCDALSDIYYGGTVEDKNNIIIEENNSPLNWANWHCKEIVPSGTTGDCTWTLDGTVLNISGSGAMEDYISPAFENGGTPWGTLITEVIIEEGVTYIGEHAFDNCSLLTKVTIADSVNTFGSSAFANCSAITDITIPEGVTSLSEYAFFYCTALESVTLPNSLVNIESYAFRCCSSLKNVVFGNSLQTIGESAFSDCYSLENLTLPNSVKNIEGFAFYGCFNLNNFDFGSSITTIGAAAFADCTSLENVVLPISLELIDDSAFGGCETLKDVYYGGDYKTRTQIVFYSSNEAILNATWHYNYGIEPETLKGDVNGDGTVNVSDLAQLKKLLAGLLSIEEAATLNADVDGNATVNAADLALLKKALAGLVSLEDNNDNNGNNNNNDNTDENEAQVPLEEVPLNIDYEVADDFKIGVIVLHDENSSYDKNFIDGINKVKTALNLKDEQVIIKTNIMESNDCYIAAKELVQAGCDIVFADSYGHENYLIKAAKEFPDVEFCHASGVMAHTQGLDNFHNAFANIFEGRYLAGVAAGMKLNEMIKKGQISESEAKLGFVAAFPYAEVVSAYTAFYLGAKSVCQSAVMDVKFAYSWYDVENEKSLANQLIKNGCKIISQYSESMGAPMACEAAGVPNISYTENYMDACPNTAFLSVKIDWSHYFNYIIGCVSKGEKIDVDWSGGIKDGAVVLSEINSSIAAKATLEVIKENAVRIAKGNLHVFDTNNFTVNGQKLTSYIADIDGDFEPDTNVIENGIFYESTKRSAPYFDLRIDGITL